MGAGEGAAAGSGAVMRALGRVTSALFLKFQRVLKLQEEATKSARAKPLGIFKYCAVYFMNPMFYGKPP
jgi:hypothetical protein